MRIIGVRLFLLVLFFAIGARDTRADGVMRSVDSQYPGDFLRLRSTRVDVKIVGDVSLTTVEQEFVNEWNLPTDAVYSFPLPADTRATDFLFWSNDTLFRAVLKELEQSQNPGTGEGGVAALLTKYLGNNALRVRINGIPANGTQRIELHYISLCKYHQGRFDYRYPLNTEGFVTYPVESVSFAIHVTAPSAALSASAPGSPDAKVHAVDSQHWEATIDRSKVYPTSDLFFSYSIATDTLGVSFYSAANDTLDGHFALFVRPSSNPDTNKAFGKHVVFLLDRSSSTAGPALDGSVAAIRQCLHRLRERDRFNIIIFNDFTTLWSPTGVAATASNIDIAEIFLDGILPTGGSRLSGALQTALTSLGTDSLLHSILLFSDGRSPVDYASIRSQNRSKVGIFPVGIGGDVSRPRLELLAYENYGFPTFLSLSDPIDVEIVRLFDQINYPVMVDTRLEMGSNAYDLLPVIPYAVYEGSRFMLVGRYRNPVTSALSIAGTSLSGATFYDFSMPFSSDTRTYRFTESLWAKEKIDQLERQIAVYGATDSLKRLLIRISLCYNIRCMYTAYVAEKTIPVSGIDDRAEESIAATASVGDAGVTLAWTVGNIGTIKEINIYRAESADGPFVKIGSVGAHASQFVDLRPCGLYSCYKVEVVTVDGRAYLSSIVLPGKSSALVLYQNFPNPCNPSTSIRYYIPEKRADGSRGVFLSVYDLLGRSIRTLVSGEHQSGGIHEVVWDGRDDRGREVSSGVYFYRLTVGTFSSAKSTLVIH